MAPILPQRFVAPVMQAVFDIPVSPGQRQQLLRARPFRGQTGYAIDGLVGYDASFDALDAPVQAEDLLDVRPVQAVLQVSAGPEAALLNAAMPFSTVVARPGSDGLASAKQVSRSSRNRGWLSLTLHK